MTKSKTATLLVTFPFMILGFALGMFVAAFMIGFSAAKEWVEHASTTNAANQKKVREWTS